MWRLKEPRALGREALLTRPVVVLILTAFSVFLGFQLLLSVVPLYTDRAGGGSSGAGLATGAFMFSTVLTQIQMPRLLRWLGYGWTLAAGLLFLGIPALFYGFTESVEAILAVTLLRGVGFGIVTVVFVALIVKLAPASRPGEALGLLGIAITVPNIFCNPLGLWLVDRFGFGIVFVAGGLAPLLGLAAIPVIRRSAASAQGFVESSAGIFAALRRGSLLRISLVFTATTMAAGVVLTFLPLAAPGSGLFSAVGGLLIFGATTTVARWWAGRFGDRRDPHLLLAPGLLACALGMVGLPSGGLALLAGAALFGTGFGLLQNSTLILTMKRVSDSEHAMGSTLWNVAFDAGTGLGAFLFGFIIPLTGFFWAFTLSAGLVAASLILVYLDRQRPTKFST
jgi:predicted MFS family arabinose efflux permease